MKRYSWVMLLLSVLLVSATFLLARSFTEVRSPGPSTGSADVPPSGTDARLFFEWVAHGSGCHAMSSNPGDVAMEILPVQEEGGGVHVARFHLDHYKLASAGRPPEAPLKFARECALRLQVGPPSGKRIKSVKAKTGVVSSKSRDTKLTLAGVLKIGAQTIGEEIVVYEAGADHEHEENALSLAPGKKPEESFPALECMEKKLVGFDYTWIVERRGRSDEVLVELSGERVLDLIVELEDCS